MRIRLRGVRTELLQTFRLSHAMAEAGIPLAVDRWQVGAYRWLDQYFPGLDWKWAPVARSFKQLAVDHHTPRTAVGNVERPLIFAHGVTDRCKLKWDDRVISISFAGNMTESRRHTLSPLFAAYGDGFRVVSTNAGRDWPGKAWDEQYYEVLGRSALTACPDGDFIWTYRFFEAALCGSIPVIQNWCSHYEGFWYYRLSDDPESMMWREDWALHNEETARGLLTVPLQRLREAVLGG